MFRCKQTFGVVFQIMEVSNLITHHKTFHSWHTTYQREVKHLCSFNERLFPSQTETWNHSTHLAPLGQLKRTFKTHQFHFLHIFVVNSCHLLCALPSLHKLTFHPQADNYLSQLKVQLQPKKLPQDPRERDQRLADLSSAISEIADPVIADGKILISKLGPITLGTQGIKKNVDKIEVWLYRLWSSYGVYVELFSW